MKKYIIIFKKEFIGIIRDKRTIITMIVIPILLFPILLNLTGSIASNQIKNEQEKKLSVGIIGENYGNIIVKRIANLKEIKVSY
jgi:sodium transport system permease protein